MVIIYFCISIRRLVIGYLCNLEYFFLDMIICNIFIFYIVVFGLSIFFLKYFVEKNEEC